MQWKKHKMHYPNLWDDLEQHINTFFENKNLSDLLKQNN